MEVNLFVQDLLKTCKKRFIYLALADPQKVFKQHLIKKEEQTSYWKICSVHFDEVSTM